MRKWTDKEIIAWDKLAEEHNLKKYNEFKKMLWPPLYRRIIASLTIPIALSVYFIVGLIKGFLGRD